MVNPQSAIFRNISQRGYLDGWTLEQVIMRQAVKLIEEACELFLAYPFPTGNPKFYELAMLCHKLKVLAGEIFDDRAQWQFGNHLEITGKQEAEMADCAVVLSTMAQAIQEKQRQPFSLMAAAVAKSAADVERGVR